MAQAARAIGVDQFVETCAALECAGKSSLMELQGEFEFSLRPGSISVGAPPGAISLVAA